MDNLNYGIIGNGRSAAMISQSGSIDWFCLPEFDSDSVFASLLDKEKGGHFRIITSSNYRVYQSYVKNTNILSTFFTDGENTFELLDFMPRYKTSVNSSFTPPEIYRYIRYISGNPIIKVEYNPKLNFAKGKTRNEINGNYIKSYAIEGGYESIYLYTSLAYEDIIQENEIRIEQSHYLLLSYNQKLVDINIDRAYLEYQRTKVYWLNWINRSKVYDNYNDVISRSLLVLKLLSYQRSGAFLAAATTSLPETIGEERNWDYRFCWLRDASMTLDTLVRMGHLSAARKYMSYIKNIIRSKDESFQIMYGIRGEKILEEKILDHLSGYKNSKPVRVGNAAYMQNQNDIYGFLMELIYLYYQYFAGTLDETEDIWSITRSLVRTVAANWKLPDHGIWEIRTETKHYVLSKVLCWVAVDRAIAISKLIEKTDFIEEWEKLAEEIKDDIYKNGWSESKQAFVQSYGEEYLDASILLMEQYGFIAAEDDKYVTTVQAIKKELFYEGLMFRYIHSDGLGLPGSSFTICTFWLVRALFVTGNKEEAREILDTLLTYSNHLKLFSEDIDFKTKELLGNFPQAYSHVALIQTASLFAMEKKRPSFIKP